MNSAAASYGPADISAEAEWESFVSQFTKAAEVRATTVEPTAAEEAFILARLEEEFKYLPSVDEDWDSYDNFRQCLKDLDYNSTPGLPYMREAPTIGKFLGWDGIGAFNEAQVERLWYDVQLILAGKADPHLFRCFVKDEPHKQAKIAAKRWRLIMCAGLAQQMVWRLATRKQNQWLNDHPYDCPSGHGLVFCYGGWRRFIAHCDAQNLNWSSDLSSWDVYAPGWVFRVVKQLRLRAGGPSNWQRTLDYLYRDAFCESRIKFSNGMVVQQTFEGVMKSGLFVTISDNSIAQSAMRIGAAFRIRRRPWRRKVTGDDVLEESFTDTYRVALESLGCRVKEYEKSRVFMGTDFSGPPTPVYFAKHIVNFWTTEEHREERLDSYARLWSHHDSIFAFWKKVAQLSGVTLRSQAYYQFWYDSPFAKLFQAVGWQSIV